MSSTVSTLCGQNSIAFPANTYLVAFRTYTFWLSPTSIQTLFTQNSFFPETARKKAFSFCLPKSVGFPIFNV